MGCGLSVPEQEPINIGKTERRPRTVTIGQSERVINNRKQGNGMTASNSSRGATSIVSLEADEDTTNELPKLDHNGHLMPEEVVRRTSLSLSVSKVAVGTKEKGGKELRIEVRLVYSLFGAVLISQNSSHESPVFSRSMPTDHSVAIIPTVSTKISIEMFFPFLLYDISLTQWSCLVTKTKIQKRTIKISMA